MLVEAVEEVVHRALTAIESRQWARMHTTVTPLRPSQLS
jgi:hypothetical protein